MEYHLSSLGQFAHRTEAGMTDSQRENPRGRISGLRATETKAVAQRCPNREDVEKAEAACASGGCLCTNVLRLAAFTATLRQTEEAASLRDPNVAWSHERLAPTTGTPLTSQRSSPGPTGRRAPRAGSRTDTWRFPATGTSDLPSPVVIRRSHCGQGSCCDLKRRCVVM
jgi:hypothetical protein